jgi:hypothetical protein
MNGEKIEIENDICIDFVIDRVDAMQLKNKFFSHISYIFYSATIFIFD